jgi:hypothetical protein
MLLVIPHLIFGKIDRPNVYCILKELGIPQDWYREKIRINSIAYMKMKCVLYKKEASNLQIVGI